ncbi:MAG: RnfABCDGE type electron transport complex subunit G [Candidatus Zophobacter franzmannii]|jgi:electron transport complex protein RnfG|nr:RnfABCDGE type electron transport complex subunit G [Candidatus Zophobacter franzmannii]
MKYYIKLGLILLAVCALATGILAYLNSVTAPMIAEVKRVEAENARKEVMPDATDFVKKTMVDSSEVDTDLYFIAVNEAKEPIGYILTVALNGYSGVVKTVVGLKNDFSINKIKVIEQTETPGLGAKASTPAFAEKFVGMTLPQLMVKKDGGDIISITGATITTRTVTNSINAGIKRLEEVLKVEVTNG